MSSGNLKSNKIWKRGEKQNENLYNLLNNKVTQTWRYLGLPSTGKSIKGIRAHLSCLHTLMFLNSKRINGYFRTSCTF